MPEYTWICQILNLSQWLLFSEAAIGGVLQKKKFLKILQNLLENTYTRVSLSIKLKASVCNFIKKEILAQVFSCEYREIFTNTFFTKDFPYLKEAQAVFLESKNLSFFYSIWICLIIFSRLNNFISEVLNCCYLLRPKVLGALNFTQLVRYTVNISVMIFY